MHLSIQVLEHLVDYQFQLVHSMVMVIILAVILKVLVLQVLVMLLVKLQAFLMRQVLFLF